VKRKLILWMHIFMKCSVCLFELRMAAMAVRVSGTMKRRKEEMTLVVVCNPSFVWSLYMCGVSNISTILMRRLRAGGIREIG